MRISTRRQISVVIAVLGVRRSYASVSYRTLRLVHFGPVMSRALAVGTHRAWCIHCLLRSLRELRPAEARRSGIHGSGDADMSPCGSYSRRRLQRIDGRRRSRCVLRDRETCVSHGNRQWVRVVERGFPAKKDCANPSRRGVTAQGRVFGPSNPFQPLAQTTRLSALCLSGSA